MTDPTTWINPLRPRPTSIEKWRHDMRRRGWAELHNSRPSDHHNDPALITEYRHIDSGWDVVGWQFVVADLKGQRWWEDY